MAITTSKKRTRTLWAFIGGIVLVAAVVVAVLLINSSRSGEGVGHPVAQLPDDTSMGVLELHVHDLELMRTYYESGVGMSVFAETEDGVTLGYDIPIMQLTAEPDGEQWASQAEAGLYHSAILYPEEAALAAVLSNLATVAPNTYQGSADHAVSLAFYFVDPEGNGLELYVDTPPETWRWVDGEVQMGSAPLDPNAFMQQHMSAAAGEGTEATMGHVHMKVGDLATAEAFYADALGFAVTARSNGALFYAAGGYHHHLATNVWNSEGAEARTNLTGLGSLTVEVGDPQSINAMGDRLASAGYNFERHDDGLTVADPWGNTVHVTLVAAT